MFALWKDASLCRFDCGKRDSPCSGRVHGPFAKVAGRGIRKLQEAGIEVTVGVLETECLALNRRFMTFHTHRRPYITLKWLNRPMALWMACARTMKRKTLRILHAVHPDVGTSLPGGSSGYFGRAADRSGRQSFAEFEGFGRVNLLYAWW